MSKMWSKQVYLWVNSNFDFGASNIDFGAFYIDFGASNIATKNVWLVQTLMKRVAIYLENKKVRYNSSFWLDPSKKKKNDLKETYGPNCRNRDICSSFFIRTHPRLLPTLHIGRNRKLSRVNNKGS